MQQGVCSANQTHAPRSLLDESFIVPVFKYRRRADAFRVHLELYLRLLSLVYFIACEV